MDSCSTGAGGNALSATHASSDLNVVDKSGCTYREGQLRSVMFREPDADLVYCYTMAQGLWHRMRPDDAPLRGTAEDLPQWRANGTASVPSSLSAHHPGCAHQVNSRIPRLMKVLSVASLVASVGSADDDDAESSRPISPGPSPDTDMTNSAPGASFGKGTHQPEINVTKSVFSEERLSEETLPCAPIVSPRVRNAWDPQVRDRDNRILLEAIRRAEGNTHQTARRTKFFPSDHERRQDRDDTRSNPRRHELPELQMSCYRVLRKVKQDEFFDEARPMPQRPRLAFGLAVADKLRHVTGLVGGFCRKMVQRKKH